MIIPKNHISIVAESDIREICKQLFGNTTINFFVYVRFYDNGSHIVLPSHALWHQHFWKNDYQKNSRLCLRSGIRLWRLEEIFTQASFDAKKLFNIDNKFEIIERGTDYYDLFGFGAVAGDDSINEYYFTNLNDLKQFTYYFRDKAHALIESCKTKKENRLFSGPVKNNSTSCKHNNAHQRVYIFDKVRSFFVNANNEEVSLSRREMACVLLAVKGRSAVEIGARLNISHKTAESYIANAKEKLNCNSKAELFDWAYQLGILDLTHD